MIIIEDTNRFSQLQQSCVATIGKFDGVHLGHQLILDQLKHRAVLLNLPSLVILIEPHPEEFFAGPGGDSPARLTSLREKLALLESFGIDFVFQLTFDKALSELSRVIKNEGVFITHIANYRLSDSDDEPVETGRISAGPDSFTYLGDDTIPSINVGKEWFFKALDRAGFTPGLIAIRDPPTEKYFLWFVGIKRA